MKIIKSRVHFKRTYQATFEDLSIISFQVQTDPCERDSCRGQSLFSFSIWSLDLDYLIKNLKLLTFTKLQNLVWPLTGCSEHSRLASATLTTQSRRCCVWLTPKICIKYSKHGSSSISANIDSWCLAYFDPTKYIMKGIFLIFLLFNFLVRMLFTICRNYNFVLWPLQGNNNFCLNSISSKFKYQFYFKNLFVMDSNL